MTSLYFIIMNTFPSNTMSLFLKFRRVFKHLTPFGASFWVLMGVVGAGIAWGSPADEGTSEILRAIARVDSLLAVGDLPAALDEARVLKARHGNDPYQGWQIEARLGVALLRSGDPASAIPSLEYAIRTAPNLPENHRNLGAALVALGRTGRALSEYAQAMELAPLDFTLRLEYGQLLLNFHDIPRAREQLQTAARLCGDCSEVQEPLARMYLAAGEFAQAIPVLEDLLGRQPTPGIRRSLIQALQGAGRDSLLMEFLGRGPLVELAADEAMLLVEVEGRLNRPLHSLEFAQAVSDEALEARSVPPPVRGRGDFWGRVSYNLLLAEKNRPALSALNRAIILDPDNVIYHNNRVVLLTRLGSHEEAAREWQKVLTLDPTLEGSEKR